jgi:hypothetical protein
MEFSYVIGLWAIIALIVGSVFVGVAIQLLGEPSFGYEWLTTAIGAGVGAFVASEFIVGLRAWEPVFDGLAVAPAVVGGLVVGAIVAIATRLLSSGTSQSHSAA